MRLSIRVGVLGVLVLVGGWRPAFAQADRRASLTVAIAIDPSIGGNVTSASAATINNVPLVINETSWTDSHSESSPLFSIDFGYEVGRRAEALVGFEYGHAGADLVTVGSVGTTAASASFSPYEFWGLEGGVRVGLNKGRGAFGAVTVGFRHVSAIAATFSAQGLLTGGRDFYDGSAVPSFGFGGGFIFGSTNVGIGFEAGVKYAGSLKAASPALPAASAGERWSVPIGILLRF